MKRMIGLCLWVLILLSLPISVCALPQAPHSSENAKSVDIEVDGNTMTICAEGYAAKIDWTSFDLYGGEETVQFADGDKRYLNLVYGKEPSFIDGIIRGRANVYIINPNGVIFGSNCQIDVANLFVSTCAIDQSLIDSFEKGNLSGILNNADTQPNGDIKIYGTVNADSIQLEGKNVCFADSAASNIPFDKITVISDGKETVSGSTLSEGNVWIVAAIGVVAVVVAVAAIVIVKKKKTKTEK